MTKIPKQLAKNKITSLNLKNKKKNKDDLYAENYLKIVSTSIGVRQQNKLPRELALYLAECRASHKNLTLFF